MRQKTNSAHSVRHTCISQYRNSRSSVSIEPDDCYCAPLPLDATSV